MDSLRIGDADRDRALALLGEHYAEGRLSRDELDERSDAVWSARTEGDLAPVFADLPVRRRSGAGSGRQPGALSPHRRWGQRPFPVLVLFVVALAVVTHLPVVLLALLGWFVLARHGLVPSPPWSHGGPAGQISGRRRAVRGSCS